MLVRFQPGGQMNCGECNNEFEPPKYNSKYCSRTCYQRAKDKRVWKRKTINKPFTKICLWCKVTFNSPHSKYDFCSEDCRKYSFSSKMKIFLDIPQCLEDASRKLDKILGYVRVYVPMHPEANTWGYVYEHRVIAEQMIGRRLEPDEIVHHKNGKRWDNRVENLEVMDKIEHAKLHGQREEDLEI